MMHHYLQVAISCAITGAGLVMMVMGREIPEWYRDGWTMTLGFVFGSLGSRIGSAQATANPAAIERDRRE